MGAVSAGDDDRSPDRDPRTVQQSTLVVNGLDVSLLTERYLELLRAGGVDCWHKSIDSVLEFADTYNFIDQHPGQIAATTTVGQIREAKRQGKLALVFGCQSAEFLQAPYYDPAGGRARTALRAYYQLGLRILGIAYNMTNAFGSGNIEPHIGLTKAGRLLVEEIHGLGMVLDVGGHTGEQTTLDAIAISAGLPVISSHTNVKSLNDNPRCVSDRVIDAIAATGGVIGINAERDFVMRNRGNADLPEAPLATLDRHLDEYDYLRKRVGVDHVGLGPDFVEGISLVIGDNVNRVVWPREMNSDGPLKYVTGFEDISKLPSVTRGLIARGWSTAEIRKALGENWLRVYQRVWGS
jgi:membrane dipeptidase